MRKDQNLESGPLNSKGELYWILALNSTQDKEMAEIQRSGGGIGGTCSAIHFTQYPVIGASKKQWFLLS